MTPARPPRHLLSGIGIALGVWALLTAFQGFGVLRIPDLKLLDWHYQLRGERPASDRLALVAVDDATISEYGRWPLPRETYAVLLAALQASGVRAVGFDLLFLGEDENDRQGDRLLAGVSSQSPEVVHAMAFVSDDPALGGGAATAPFQDALLMRHGLPVSGRWPASAVRVSLPYDALLAETPALGHVSVAVDPDGVVRSVPQFVRYGDRVYPSLAFRLAMSGRGDSLPPRLTAEREQVVVRWSDGDGLSVPVDAQGASGIVFAGDRGSFHRTYSMIEVLRWFRDGETSRLRETFENRMVLVGSTALGEVATDIGATPFAEATPLVFIHANALNAVLEGRFLREPPRAPFLAALAVLLALLGWRFMSLALPQGIALMAGATAGLALADFGAFVLGGWEVPGTILLLAVPLTYAGTEIYRRALVDRATRVREREMQVARTIQRKLLPTGPPETSQLDVWGVNIPAQEVGGDYYDWTPVARTGLAVCVGDVSGKGVAAALLMSHLRASFHAEARGRTSPREIVQAMHASLLPATERGRFATFFLALFGVNGSNLLYCNAGHNPALLIHGGEVRLLEATGLPLAMLETTEYEEGRCAFEPGHSLVLYSDGVTEAQLGSELYGDERLRALVTRPARRELPARALAESILEDVRAFTRGNLDADDVTIVVVRKR